MRLARKLALLTAMALTALAFGATSASAESVEFIDEDAQQPCSPCIVHAEGDSSLTAHTIFGPIQVSACHDSFEAEIAHEENGTEEHFGHIYEYHNNHGEVGGDDCTRENCENSQQEREWDMMHPEETAANEGTMDVRFCLRDEQGNENHCTIKVHVEETGEDPHGYTFTADPDDPINPTLCDVNGTEVEVAGVWTTETSPDHDEIEIVHL